MTLTLQAVRVVGEDSDGRLVFVDGALVALLVCLSANHAADAGRWFLEFGLGGLDGPDHPMFDDLQAGELWIGSRLGA